MFESKQIHDIVYYPEIEVVTYLIGESGHGWSESKLFFSNYNVSSLDFPIKKFGSKRKAHEDAFTRMNEELLKEDNDIKNREAFDSLDKEHQVAFAKWMMYILPHLQIW